MGTYGVSRFRRPAVQEVYNRFAWYLKDPRTNGTGGRGRGKTRAQIEFALVISLIEDAGCTDDEIRELFDEWQPLKHAEKLKDVPGNPYGYLDLTIKNARARADLQPGANRKRRDKRAGIGAGGPASGAHAPRRRQKYGEPLMVKQACERIAESGCTQRTG